MGEKSEISLSKTLKLEGKLPFLQENKKPLVGFGRIIDNDGNILVKHSK